MCQPNKLVTHKFFLLQKIYIVEMEYKKMVYVFRALHYVPEFNKVIRDYLQTIEELVE